MTRAAAFTAEIIRSSRRGLAGLAAALLFERVAEATERYENEGFETWRKTIAARLEVLSSALEAGDSSMFSEDARWFRRISLSRGIPRTDLVNAYECMEETLRGQLPEEAFGSVESLMRDAHDSLEDDDPPAEEFVAGSDANKLFDLALLGDLGGARRFMLDGVKDGRFDFEGAVVGIFLPAAREAGRRWHLGEMGVATEHVITSTLRSALFSLTAILDAPVPNGKACFIAAVPGDAHDTGLAALALLLENRGWRVALAGADTPIEEIDITAEGYECDLIAVSATLTSQRYALSSYLSRRTSKCPVLVGGAAVRDVEDALRLGAAGFARDLVEGVKCAEELVGL